MTERRGFKLPSILPPEGLSVIKPFFQELDREARQRQASRAIVEKRLSELSKTNPQKNPDSKL